MKPEDCPILDTCIRVKRILDQDILDSQYSQAIREQCEGCAPSVNLGGTEYILKGRRYPVMMSEVETKQARTPQEAVEEIRRALFYPLSRSEQKNILRIIEALEADAYTRGIEDGRQGE